MIKKILLMFSFWQIAIVVITIISPQVIRLKEGYLGGSTSEYLTFPLIYSRANFDGNHYLSIANYGYGYAQQAFFPLYPALIRTISLFGYSPLLISISISVVCSFLGIFIFLKLVELDFNESTALWTIVGLLIYPTSFFISFSYTEGLFFLLSVTTLYLMRANKYFLSSVVAGLASYCRLAGLILLPTYIIHLYEIKRLNLKNLSLSLIFPLGLITYMYQLFTGYSDAFMFVHVQKYFNNGRGENLVILPQVFWRYIKIVATADRLNNTYTVALLELFTATITIIGLIYAWKKIKKSYFIFSALSFVLPTLTGTFTSLSRYVLMCFPLFIIYGHLLSTQNMRTKTSLIISQTLISIAYLILFVRGYWVS